MKKIIAALLCSLLVLTCAACAGTDKPVETPEIETERESVVVPEPGGWMDAEDPALTDELKAIYEKGLEGLVGVDYTPIALLGTQVVAGMNYCFLSQGTVVYPGSTPMYMLVFLYADLSGNVTVLNIENLPIIAEDDGTLTAPSAEALSGGWTYADSYEVTDEMKDRLNKALSETVGADYDPIANLGTQVVAGLNRCLLCRVTPVVPNAVPHYAFVYVYEDLEGGAQLLYVIGFDYSAYCTYGA